MPFEKGNKYAKRKGKLKESRRRELMEYLSNPDNKFLKRNEFAIKIFGLGSKTQIYEHFSPDELCAIENEALTLRRERYAGMLARVDAGLLRRAEEGDPAAVKLAYQRFEGFSEKQTVSFDGPMLQQVFAMFPPEIADKLRLALAEKQDAIDVGVLTDEQNTKTRGKI